MGDPHLESVHLDTDRREIFRQARATLLNARGEQTRLAEQQDVMALNSRTKIHRFQDRIPKAMDYVLMDKDEIYDLKIGINTIGRLPDNNVVIKDAHISRRHCAIVVHANKGCELHDVASKNGTFINGKPLAGPTPLVSGDEVRLCDRLFVFLRRADLPAPEPEDDHTQID